MACVVMMMALPMCAAELPRVLVIGDAVYAQHARGVSSDLKDRASVSMATWPEGEVPSSTTALTHLDQLLGFVDRNGQPVPEDRLPKWDLIHVNVGLGDLIHRVPNMDSFRVLPIHMGGVVTTSPERYRENVDALLTKLKATGAKVVWASTTPIRHSRSNVFEIGAEVQYNAIASEVAAKHGIETNDMYGYVKHLINMDKPAGHGADPFNFDKKPIHMPIVRAVERVFGFEPIAETEEEKAVREAKQRPAPTQG
jgi:hypothetical protein